MTRGKQLLFSVILGCLSLVLALAVAEFAVRLVVPQPTGLAHQDRYGLALHYPGITRYLPQFGHEVSFNSVGMRDREHPIAKPPGTFRILLLGDSFMEALQVPQDSMLAALMERDLTKATGRPVEVINGGVSGWGTDDALRYLTEYGLAYKPDLVVVAMTLHNDLSDNFRRTWHTLKGDTLVTLNPPPMSWTDYKITEIKAFIATRFQLYQLWRRVRHGGEIRKVGKALNSHVVQLFHEPSSEGIAYAWRLTDHLLGAIRDTTRASGAQVAVVMLPLVYQLADTSFAQFVKLSEVPPAEMRMDKPQMMVRQATDSLGIATIDLLPGFRAWVAAGKPKLYLGWDGHWNDAGHRLAADSVVSGLLQANLVPRATGP